MFDFEYNGVRYAFDIRDADDMERYEKAMKELAEEQQNAGGETASARMRAACASYRKLFDDIFGKGAGIAVCGEKDNTGTCSDAFYALLNFVADANAAENERLDGLAEEYSRKRLGTKG